MPLTAAEQMMLELINRTRLDPLEEADRFGIDLNKGFAAGTLTGEAKQVVAHNEILHSSAENHSQWLLDNNEFVHRYNDGAQGLSTPASRAADAGYAQTGLLGENLAVSGTSGTADLNTMIIEQHANLFQSDRHRKNMLREEYEEVGIGQRASSFTFSNGQLNSSMVTQVFAESGPQVFLSDVVHTDRNNNDFYNIGEGVRGLSTSTGENSTTSAVAGGYTLALDADQNSVAVTLGSGSTALQVLADLSQGSGKLDVVNGDELRSSVNLTLVSGVEKATLLGVDDLNLTGANTSDRLEGNKANNILAGRDGDDVLAGGEGNDILHGDAGADVLLGGAGSDVASYQTSRSWVNVSLASGYTGGGGGNHASGDRFISIEHLTGSLHNDRLNGSHGDDIIQGYRGVDIFIFDDNFGNDQILDFVDGSERLDFSSNSSNSSITQISDLNIGTSSTSAVVSDDAGNSITLSNMAGLIDGSDFSF